MSFQKYVIGTFDVGFNIYKYIIVVITLCF
jgi:hypothetical protein